MVASTLQQPRREWFDILDDWLNATALSLWGWFDYFFPLLIWQLGKFTGTTFVTVGTLTGWRLPTLRVLIFSQLVSTPADAMGHSLLLLWGPESQGDFVRLGPTWGL